MYKAYLQKTVMLAKMKALTEMVTMAVLNVMETAVHGMVESNAYLMVVVVGMHVFQELQMKSEYVSVMMHTVSVVVMHAEEMVWETIGVVVAKDAERSYSFEL